MQEAVERSNYTGNGQIVNIYHLTDDLFLESGMVNHYDFQKNRRKRLLAIAAIRNATINPPKKLMQFRLTSSVPDRTESRYWFRNMNAVIQAPRKMIATAKLAVPIRRLSQPRLGLCV